MIKYLISLKAAFSQDLLISDGNITTSSKLLGSGIKWDASEPYSTKVGNEFFNSFTTALNNLCKPLTIFFDESSAPFHSF